MANLTLYVGTKNVSSWSLRPWLALEQSGEPFDEVVIPLDRPDTRARLLELSPSGRVPLLRDGELAIWDSLAICEYLAERHPELWPEDREARAVARAVSAEMHSGFAALRQNMPMNVRLHAPGRGRAPGVGEDISRVVAIWRDCRARYGAGGPFLFGRRSIADAMFAPVVTRFSTYEVALEGEAAAYARAIWALPAMQRWLADCREEPDALSKGDPP